MIGTALVETAIVQALRDAAIVAEDHVVRAPVGDPAVLGFPFIEVGDTHAISDDVTGHNGVEEYLDLHIWSRSGDQGEVKTIIGAIAVVLNAAVFDVDGFDSVHVSIRDSRVITGVYGFNRHGVVTIRIRAFAA